MNTEIIRYVSFAISITCISWIIGMILNELIKNKPYYSYLSNLNFIKSERLNRIIGLRLFKWIVKNTFFKYLNQKLKLNNKIELTDLNCLRNEMVFSEISHLIGFVVVTIFALVKVVNGNFLFSLLIMVINIVLNLYPTLLQQENKRRIDQLIKKFS